MCSGRGEQLSERVRNRTPNGTGNPCNRGLMTGLLPGVLRDPMTYSYEICVKSHTGYNDSTRDTTERESGVYRKLDVSFGEHVAFLITHQGQRQEE